MKNKAIKSILGVIGLIILSAIGSGLWQIGLEPVGSWLFDVFFKITTLGSSSLSDAFYQEVAKGLHEESSVHALFLLWLGSIYLISSRWGDMRTGKYNKVHISNEEDAIVNKINENEDLSPEEKQAQIKEAKANYYEKILCSYKRSCIRTKIILIFFAAFLTFQCFTIIQRNYVITRFRRAFSATKFAMSEQEEELILLRFSVIQNKQDYLDVLDTLQEKLKEAKKEIEDATSSGDVKDKTE